jgi:pimeloyl-ACP methyl ester carboxylesterase
MKIRKETFIAAIVGATIAFALAARPAGAEPAAGYLETGGGKIAYSDSGGAGQLVVCAPGIGDVRQEYRFLAPRLQAAGFRVVTMDLRGLGESSVGWSDYSAAAVGADIVALIRHLGGSGKAFIIGNSMAGAAAVWAAAQAPERVAGIILLDPFVREMPTPWYLSALLGAMAMRPWGPWAWSSYYGSLYKTAPPADLGEYRSALVANLREPGRIEAVKAMLLASKAPCEARIAEVKAPVLVMMGTRDSDFDDPAAEADWVATHLHGRKVMVEGAGHYPHVEYPDVAAAAATEFMKESADGVASRN